MDIRTAQIFCDLVDLQNISRTAEKHGLSQSAISQQLAQLELEHNCQLINRKKRPLALTPAGQSFHRACKDIVERYNLLKSELKALAQSTTRINVVAIFSIGMHTLQPYVKKFMARYPKVNLSVDYYSASEIYESILTGEIDIGIVAVPKTIRNIDVYPLQSEPLVLVCGPDHILSNSSIVDIHKIQGMDFIAFDKDVPSRTLIDSILTQHNVNVRTVMEFDNIETIKRAVEINAGVSILPEITVHTELANGTLRAMPFSNGQFVRPTGVIVRKNKTLTQAGRYLIELLHKESGDVL